jgi:Putative Ig domain/Photosynthesis system II assembly factor YCF48
MFRKSVLRAQLAAVLLVGAFVCIGAVVAPATAEASTTWTMVGGISGPTLSSLTSISCATTSVCFAVGTQGLQGTTAVALESTDGGTSFALDQNFPSSSASSLLAIACPSTSTCFVVGKAISTSATMMFATTDGGTTWAFQSLPSGAVLSGIACTSETTCVAVGGSGSAGSVVTTSDGGTTWTPETLPSGVDPTSSIACPSPSVCFAPAYSHTSPGYTILVTTDGGSSWSTEGGLPNDINGTYGMTCTSTTHCLIAAHTTNSTALMLTTNDGVTWSGSSVTSSATEVTGVACLSGSSCVASGQYMSGSSYVAAMFVTTNGGSSWATDDLPADVSQVLNVACTTTTCFGAAGGTVDGGVGAVFVIAGAAPTPPSIATGSLPSGTVGNAYSASLAASGGQSPYSWNISSGALAPGLSLNGSNGTISGTPSASGGFSATFEVTDSGGSTASVSLAMTITATHGYWLIGSDGGVFSFGSAQFYGSTGGLHLQRPVVGMSPTSNRGGYWMVGSDGGVFAFGNAGFVGSIPGLGLHPAGSGLPGSLNAPIVGMVPSRDGGGYFMVASDGGVFAFGDAHFAGSCPGIGGCAGSAVAVMPDASGNGYWLVTNTGHVYTFGDAGFFGAPGPQASPVSSAVATPDGGGYWILNQTGQVFAYGDAASFGSVPSGSTGGFNPASAIFATSDGGGYWVSDGLGKVFTFGDAPNDGDMSGTHLNGPIVAANGN